MSKYYVITAGEDGIDIREYASAEAVTRSLIHEGEEQPTFLSEMPGIDKGSFYDDKRHRGFPETATVLIKGDIVVPKPVQRVTEWDIE